MQLLPHLKEPLVTLICVTVRNLDVTKMSLRLSVRRKETRGIVLKTPLQRGDEERSLKCFCMIDDIERRAGLYVIDNKRNATRLVSGGLAGFECFVACDSVYALDFVLEEREIVSTVVKVLDKFIGA